MKKLLLFSIIAIICGKNILVAQCPPSATAFAINYSLCIPEPGCAVLLNGWPKGVLVNIFGGSPLQTITTVQIPGTYPEPGVDNAFVCVPCNVPLVFASTVPGATNGCVIISTISVPIKLSRFEAIPSAGNTCNIEWSASSQTGSEKFVIERSVDGKNFAELATVYALKTDNVEKNYSYTDKIPNQPQLFYRIKTVEITGKLSYSTTVSVKNKADFGMSIYPNPAINTFKVNVSPQHLPALIKIYNAQGEIVYSAKTTEPTVEVKEKIPSGVYSVKVFSANNILLTQKMIKQ
ncbi:T9SS type A sorting domain-containing protein [Ferruginibacter lapsinanis]|uniref:T9SS type A sorting domain-containing protein n=1 Tax=Ferruginibacter lapsinanis TaxID=563172 RepID=UPI001E3E5742|nr:T9SS type A sorting domain-containing protein [Ferruginibacter lapsinanis]UEG50063.1 T9SS type A sorting domain-containing protein [Ferruginibacter lapsinanis]